MEKSKIRTNRKLITWKTNFSDKSLLAAWKPCYRDEHSIFINIANILWLQSTFISLFRFIYKQPLTYGSWILFIRVPFAIASILLHSIYLSCFQIFCQPFYAIQMIKFMDWLAEQLTSRKSVSLLRIYDRYFWTNERKKRIQEAKQQQQQDKMEQYKPI